MFSSVILLLCLVIVSGSPIVELNGHNRIYNGDIAEANAFPYSVGLLRATNQGPGFCGGALISKSHVLTSANCLIGVNIAIVIIGAQSRLTVEEGQQRITVNENTFIMHEEFNKDTLANNIALIQLPRQVEYSAKIQAIQLPSRSLESIKFDNLDASTNGWGHSEGEIEFSDHLRYVNLTILPLTICKHYYSPTIVTSKNICTDGAFGKGICSGDEGGPLTVILGDGTEIFIGIASFLSDIGCNSRWPTVYTKLIPYLDWIYERAGLIENNDLLQVLVN